MCMLTPPMMFDGDDEDYQPFADLLQKLQHSIQVDSTFSDVGLEDLIPICLYGTALRYFESLDSDCQSDASQLTVALETRFPRRSVPVVGAPAVVAACPPSSDAYGISTPAAIAPATVSSLASPTHQAPEIKPKSSASKIMGSLMDVTEKIRYVSIARPLMPPTEELSPQVEIPLFYIDHHSSSYPTIVKRVFELDPRDYKAVAETAKKRLFDLSQYEANRLYIGMRWGMNYGTRSVVFCNDVSGPSSVFFAVGFGDFGVSPERECFSYKWSPTLRLMDVIRDTSSKAWGRRGSQTAKPGNYTIKTFIRTKFPGMKEERFRMDYGVVKWRIRVGVL